MNLKRGNPLQKTLTPAHNKGPSDIVLYLVPAGDLRYPAYLHS